MLRRLALLVPAAVAIVAVVACANDGYGIEACRTIEAERCRWVVQCGIDVGVRRNNESSPVDDCIRYYDVACMHGMQYLTQDPSDTQTNTCATAIHNATSCDIVTAPENAAACAWLKPSTDAGTDAASDAATDATGQ